MSLAITQSTSGLLYNGLFLDCVQVGLNYICATAERFFAVGAVLGNMVVAQAQVQDLPSQRLLKHIIRCYLRLSDNPR